MNSPTDKQPNSTPAAPQPPQAEINPEVLILAKQKLLLAKTVWLLLVEHNCNAGNSHAIDDASIPDLWNLKFNENEKGHLLVRAEMLPEITTAQIRDVVDFLLGTKRSVHEAIEKFKLVQPPDYVTAMIRDLTVQVDGTWTDALSLHID